MIATFRLRSYNSCMNILRLTLLLLLTTVSTTAAALVGTVRDSEGAVIPHAVVIIHWDAAGSNYLKDNIGIKEDVTATTDSNGRFSVSLPPGFYDVFVAATAFSPSCDKIRLKGNGSKTYDVKLKVSQLTLQELD